MPNNSLMTIKPYWHNETWVFDDDRVGLVAEPFVAGADDILTDMVTEYLPPSARPYQGGFRALFSAEPFPGYHRQFTRLHEESGGCWYKCDATGKEGWLCSQLFSYFDVAPQNLYVKVEPLGGQ